VKRTLKEDLESALRYTFLLLKYRPRSEKELTLRLKRKGFALDLIQAALRFLREKRFIDDKSFARLWTQARLRRPFGPARIKQELKIKGISSEIIEEILKEQLQHYDENELILALAKKRLLHLKGLPREKRRQRLYAYLVRRGFSPEKSIEALYALT